MTQNRLILHIGRHKSGTSSLQQFLFDNSDRLESLGWYYPASSNGKIAHHDLASYYCPNQVRDLTNPEKNDLEKVVKDYWRRVKSKPASVISSENFQNARPDLLRDDLQGMDVEIVIYLREIIDYFQSAYAQFIKAQKSAVLMQDYLTNTFKVDYGQFLSGWRTSFPEAKITVCPYPEIKKGFSIVDDFFKNTSLNPLHKALQDGSFRPSMTKSISIYGDLLAFKYLLNMTEFETVINSGSLYKLMEKAAKKHPELCKARPISASIYQALSDHHKGPLRQLESELGLNEGSLFNDDRQISQTEFDPLSIKNMPDIPKICTVFSDLKAGLGDELSSLLGSL